MKKSWSIEVGGATYAIEYHVSFGVKVIVNGQENKVKSQSLVINLIDYPLPIPGADVRVVAIGNKIDLAVNGIYQGSGEAYKPLEQLPRMVKPMMAVSTIGGLLLSGVIGALVGAVFSLLYVKLALADKKNKIVPAFVGWVVVQVIMFVIVFRLA